MEWQPIETAPKDGTLILISAPGWKAPFIERADDLLHKDGEAWWLANATHWMPLPEAPNK